MGSSSTSWASESNTHAGSSKAYDSTSWSLYTTTSGLRISGAEGQTAQLELWADEGDDNADKWLWNIADGGSMTWQSYTSGSYATKLTLGTDGALTVVGATQLNSTLTVGVDDTGYDVKFFGATAGKYMLWDESADSLVFNNGSTQNDKFLHFLSSANYGIKFEYTGQETYEFIHGTSGFFIDLGGTNLMGWTQDHDLKIFNNSGTAYANFDGSTSRLGLGTVSPAYNFDIQVAGEASMRLLSSDNNAILRIDAASDSYNSYIYFQKNTDARGSIKYDHNGTAASETMNFYTADIGVRNLILTGNGDVTVDEGNLVITAATKGIIHTNSGTVTQGTSITTAVTLNTTSGVITMHATAIAADENIEFLVNNSTVQADSVILLTMQDENTVDNTQLVCATHTISGGSFKITVANTDSGSASSATANKIHFLVINNS